MYLLSKMVIFQPAMLVYPDAISNAMKYKDAVMNLWTNQDFNVSVFWHWLQSGYGPPSQDSSGFLKGLGWDALAEFFCFIILGVTGGHWEGGRNTQAVAAPKSFQGLGAFLKTLKLPSDHPLHVYLPHALGHLGSSKRGQFLAILFRQKVTFFCHCNMLMLLNNIPDHTLVTKKMDVSKNSVIPKSSILIGFSIINHPFWGKIHYCWKHPTFGTGNILGGVRVLTFNSWPQGPSSWLLSRLSLGRRFGLKEVTPLPR